VDSLNAELVPLHVLEQLRYRFEANTLVNSYLLKELLELLDLFYAQEIPAVPYKGPVLAITAYGDLALREFADLDILVPDRHIAASKNLLLAHGYRPVWPWGKRPLYSLTKVQEISYLRSSHEYQMVRTDKRIHIGLHWQFAPRCYPFRPDPECFWDNLETISLKGRKVSTFSKEDLIVILCLHGAKDQWRKLAWVVDVDRVIRTGEDVDWERVFNRARASHGERALLLGLCLSCGILGTPLPKEILFRTESKPVKELARNVRVSVAKETGNDEFSRCFPVKRLHIALCERFRDKFAYVLRTLTTPGASEWSRVTLPDALYPVYYLLRPIRITARCLKVLLKELV